VLALARAVSCAALGQWQQAEVYAATAAAAAALVAVRAARLARGDAMYARAQLLRTARALPPSDGWVGTEHCTFYQLEVHPGWPFFLATVVIDEMDTDGINTAPDGGRHITARRYAMSPPARGSAPWSMTGPLLGTPHARD